MDITDSTSTQLENNSDFNLLSNNQSFGYMVTRSKIGNNKSIDPIICDQANLEKNAKCGKKKAENIEKFYLNKGGKVVHQNLETIYECPIWKKGNSMLLGTSKVKRSIYLGREFRRTTKQKSRCRKIKIKKLGKKFQHIKMSDDEFKSKMLCIDNYINDTDTDADNQMKTELLNIKMKATVLNEINESHNRDDESFQMDIN